MTTDPLALVRRFFAAWETGTYAALRGAYAEFLADDCLYENSGVPPCRSKAEALAFIDLAQKARDIQAIRVEILHAAVSGNVVFTERWDRHVNSAGESIYPVRIVGVMEIRDGRIAAWRDYFDPAEMMEQLEQGRSM
jgi:limonene-1,2-epoxide hydrolase